MIDNFEWTILEPLYVEASQKIMSSWKERKSAPKMQFSESREARHVLAAFLGLTGVQLESMAEIPQRRMSSIGSPCPNCRKPFRTPKATLCIECGHELSDGQTAGPLLPEHLTDHDVKNDMSKIYFEDKLIGHSPFEYGDPPMGVAHGTFLPNSSEFEKIEFKPTIQNDDQSIFEGFEVFTPEDQLIPCEGPVSIIHYPNELRPFNWQIHIHFIPSDVYDVIFPEHAKQYADAFSDT